MTTKELIEHAVLTARSVFKNRPFQVWANDFLNETPISIERCRKIRDITVKAKKKTSVDKDKAAARAANGAVLAVIISLTEDNDLKDARPPANDSLAWARKATGEIAYGE